MPIFLVSLLKSYSLALRDRTLKPCSQVGALTLFSAARTNGRCGASNRPHRKHTRARRTICTRLDMDGPRDWWDWDSRKRHALRQKVGIAALLSTWSRHGSCRRRYPESYYSGQYTIPLFPHRTAVHFHAVYP